MIKAGILGFGKMGRTRADAITESGKGCVVQAFDTQAFTHPEIARAETPEEVWNNPEVDAVFVCTPNHKNKEFTIAALEAGKHVFCEKPPAFSAADVEEIIAAEKASGKTLQYGLNHRHHGSILKAKEAVDSGEYGNILWMRGRYGKSVDESYFDNWRAKKELVGGGILMDQGIHMLDLFLHFAGSFDDIQAMVSNLYWNLDGIEDNVFATLRNNQTGVVASLHSTMTQWRHLFSLEIFLERGHIVLNGLKTSTNSYGEEELTISKNRSCGPDVNWDHDERFTYPTDHSWLLEVDTFFSAIEKGQPVTLGSSADALKLMQTLERVYAADPSFASGK